MAEINYKKMLAEDAVKHYVHSNMAIGLGSGTTAIWVVRTIAEQYASGILQNIACVATGPGTLAEALALSLPMYHLNHPKVATLDLAIDGADEYDEQGNLLKGGGGCLLHEKIVAYSSDIFLVIAQEEKKVAHLGTHMPIPIEVIPDSLSRVQNMIAHHYDTESMELRMDAKQIGPWITEEGNYLLDVQFTQSFTPSELESSLVQLVGVVEVGVFTQKTPTIMSISSSGDINSIDYS